MERVLWYTSRRLLPCSSSAGNRPSRLFAGRGPGFQSRRAGSSRCPTWLPAEALRLLSGARETWVGSYTNEGFKLSGGAIDLVSSRGQRTERLV